MTREWDESKVNRVRNQGVPKANGRFDFKQLNEAEGGTNVLGPAVSGTDGFHPPRVRYQNPWKNDDGHKRQRPHDPYLFSQPPIAAEVTEPRVYEHASGRVTMPGSVDVERFRDETGLEHFRVPVRYEPNEGPPMDTEVTLMTNRSGYGWNLVLPDRRITDAEAPFLQAAAGAAKLFYPEYDESEDSWLRNAKHAEVMALDSIHFRNEVISEKEEEDARRAAQEAEWEAREEAARAERLAAEEAEANRVPAEKLARAATRGLARLKEWPSSRPKIKDFPAGWF